ncbi:MAG TPA: ATP-binding protein [Gaiellaceae bacterium]|jgi:signal transduction histidine kinase
MRRTLRRRMFIASAALALLVGAAFVTLLLTVLSLRDQSRLARHSEQVIATANRLERLLIDLETGHRGYVITLDPKFLKPLHDARAAYPRVGARLVELTAGEERSEARSLSRAIRAYDREWAEPVVVAVRRDPRAARAMIESGGGKARVDAIRARFERFLRDESARSDAARRDADREGEYVFALGAVGLGSSLLLIAVFAAFLVLRVVRPIRRVSSATQRLAGGNFDHRVPATGPDEIGELGRSFNAMAQSLEQSRRDLESQNTDLERLANVLRAVLDSTVDGILLTDLDGNIQLANRPMVAFTRTVGITQKGDAVDRLLSIEHKIADPERYRKTMERLRTHPDEPSFDEFELLEPHGVYQGFTAPVRGDDGHVVGRIWTMREVTQERELDRLKEEFVATVSHELRTPLTSMMGFLEMLREGEAGPLTPDQDRFLSIVYRSSERLQRLVGDLLFVARLDASGLQLQFGRVRVDAIVGEAVESLAALARARGVDLRADLDTVPAIRGDRERLAQLVGNLLSNALKFTPAGGKVVARTFSEDATAVLEVEDTGIGIPAAEQERLFQRFFRSSTATAQAIPGTGLGLVITKAIAEAHGGGVSVASKPGEGTCFRVELPVDGPPG